MPRHDYVCACGERREVFYLRDKPQVVCACGEEMSLSFATWETVRTQSAYVDNHYYNNGQGEWDEGLGAHVRSRGHRREIMARKGVAEVTDFDKDEFLKRPEYKAPDMDSMVESLEKAAFDLRNGHESAATSVPQTYSDAVDPGMDEGYDTQEVSDAEVE